MYEPHFDNHFWNRRAIYTLIHRVEGVKGERGDEREQKRKDFWKKIPGQESYNKLRCQC